MKKFSITFKNKTRQTRLQIDYKLYMIEEETIYIQENGKVFKSSLQIEIYSEDINLESINTFFNAQLNTLTEFYRTKGEFEILNTTL